MDPRFKAALDDVFSLRKKLAELLGFQPPQQFNEVPPMSATAAGNDAITSAAMGYGGQHPETLAAQLQMGRVPTAYGGFRQASAFEKQAINGQQPHVSQAALALGQPPSQGYSAEAAGLPQQFGVNPGVWKNGLDSSYNEQPSKFNPQLIARMLGAAGEALSGGVAGGGTGLPPRSTSSPGRVSTSEGRRHVTGTNDLANAWRALAGRYLSR